MVGIQLSRSDFQIYDNVRYVIAVMDVCNKEGFNETQTAEVLGVDRRTLYSWKKILEEIQDNNLKLYKDCMTARQGRHPAEGIPPDIAAIETEVEQDE